MVGAQGFAVIQLHVEPHLGGRIASIIDSRGRERLWNRPDPRRRDVVPGGAFVDVGGVEECFPTFEDPDHGEVWSRRWREEGDWLVADMADARLSRRIEVDPTGFTSRYELEAEPGYRFVWAFHALLAPHDVREVEVPQGGKVLSWPAGYQGAAREDLWPRVGVEPRFDRVGPDDGTAVFALIPDAALAVVHSLSGSFTTTLVPDDVQPVAVGIWRNLGNWPEVTPYRSWGVEPMIGWHPRRDRAGERSGLVRSGRIGWTLRVDIADAAV
jgi:hypothetical protein